MTDPSRPDASDGVVSSGGTFPVHRDQRDDQEASVRPSPKRGVVVSWHPPVSTVAVLVLVSAAALWDVTTRRVPNGLTIGSVVVAIAIHAVVGGWSGVLTSATGWCVGLALFVPLFVLGGMGAGDVKLLAAIGAWLGPSGAFWTAVYGALVGGVFAIVVALMRGYARTALRNMLTVWQAWSRGRIGAVEGVTLESNVGPRLPYALPIALGAILTVWIH